jgi:prefoldin subunit 5
MVELNEETILMLKKKVKSLERALKSMKERRAYVASQWEEVNSKWTTTQKELEGIKKILKPYLVAEEI